MSFDRLRRTVQIEPLTQWPESVERTEHRAGSRFRASFYVTALELGHELRALGAESAVLQMEFDPSELRKDGVPYQKARAGMGPGLVLSFEVGEDRFMYPADTYLEWRDNLRALVLTLRALRAVDRYGVSKAGQQYSGWKAIPADVDVRVTPEQAATVLLRTAGLEPHDQNVRDVIVHEEFRRRIYRKAASYSHPDRWGGTEAHFRRVQHALSVLALATLEGGENDA